MCITTQYLFNCSHEATHRFRSDMCSTARTRDCRIQDTNNWINFPCRKCAKSQQHLWQRWWTGSRRDSPNYDDFWHIPSRCFVDVGFRTLDPFATGNRSEPLSPLSPAPPPTESMSARKTQSIWASLQSSNRCSRLLEKMRLKHSSPCCETQTQQGAFPAVRLEGPSDRLQGRIVDDHCESLN